MSYLLHRANLSNQILPHEKTNLTSKSDEIEINGYFKGRKGKVYQIWVVEDKTLKKKVESTPKLFKFTKLRGLLYFLPQPSKNFTQIYMPYL